MNRIERTVITILLIGLLAVLSACAAQPAEQDDVEATVVAIIAATNEARDAQATIKALKQSLAQTPAANVAAPAPATPIPQPPADAKQSEATIQAAVAATVQAENALATRIAATLTAAAPDTPTASPTLTSTPSATPSPSPSPSPTSTPSPTAKPRPKPKAQVPASNSPVIVDFETWGTWRRGDEPYGTFTQTTEQVKAGSYAGKLSYNFPANEPKNYVVFRQSRPISGSPNAIEAWVYGDGSRNFLNLWVVDAHNQTWQFTFGQVDHMGWAKMIAALDVNAGWPNQPINPASARELVYPLRFDAIVFDGYREDQASSGVIYIDQIAATDDVAPAAGSTPAPASPVSGRIAFPAFDASRGQYDIYVVNADGSGLQRVAANASQPALSPDGQRIAFRSWKNDDRGLEVMNTYGGNQRRITNFLEDMQPDWSFDGSNLIFASRRESDRKSRIYQIVVDGGGDWVLMRGGGPVFGEYPTWLADGRIVYHATSPQLDLSLMNADGSNPIRVIGDGAATAPDVSPDGRSLIYMSHRDGNWEVYRANIDGSGITRLTQNGADDGLPVWSPDGNHIAFVSARDGQWAVWLMDKNGGNQRRLVVIPGSIDGRVKGEPDYNSRGWTEERISWSR